MKLTENPKSEHYKEKSFAVITPQKEKKRKNTVVLLQTLTHSLSKRLQIVTSFSVKFVCEFRIWKLFAMW